MEGLMATQDKSYRCASCNAEFNSQDELDRHMKSAHKGASTESKSGQGTERERQGQGQGSERQGQGQGSERQGQGQGQQRQGSERERGSQGSEGERGDRERESNMPR
jgi:hypothetical protein